uniref:Tetratricopeptide repeat protein 29 n=1 Tax=Melopsittacus undulatus TaxID=13146 RepID=A0A8C6NDD1_MELUD
MLFEQGIKIPLPSVLVICTYLVRQRTEYGFKGLKSIFLIPSNRNSYKKNICIDMLRQGYHKSFSELFALIEKWNALREAAGPGSAIWQQKSLEEQPDKLDQLYHFLTRAEAAHRAGHYEEVYDNQLNLAYYFNDPEDKWLSNYFYEECFNTAKLITTDIRKREAQAHANMGLIKEEQGHVLNAAEYYETFYHLTVGSTWKDVTGRTYNSLASEYLWRIYTLLADKMLENNEHQQAIKTLKKALKIAKNGRWKITFSHCFTDKHVMIFQRVKQKLSSEVKSLTKTQPTDFLLGKSLLVWQILSAASCWVTTFSLYMFI